MGGSLAAKPGARWRSGSAGFLRMKASRSSSIGSVDVRPAATEAGYPDSTIMEILGRSSMAMLRRYLGKIPVEQLKRYPTTLERVFGRAG